MRAFRYERNTMGRITRRLFGAGFDVHNDDGSVTHFRPSVFGNGYDGSDGTRVRPSVFGEFQVLQPGGGTVRFHKSAFGNGLRGSDGTRITPGLFGTKAHVRRKKK